MPGLKSNLLMIAIALAVLVALILVRRELLSSFQEENPPPAPALSR